MRIKVRNGKDYTDIGAIYLQDNKVAIDVAPKYSAFFNSGIRVNTSTGLRSVKPSEGIYYLKSLLDSLKRSSSIILNLEDRDTWYEKING